jgi:hypothetical protein
LVTSEDDALALFLSATDKLMTINFWKEFTGETIELMKTILKNYIYSNLDPGVDEVSKLISLSKSKILPQISDDK